MAQADEDDDQRESVGPVITVQPAQRTFIELHVAGIGERWQVPAGAHPQGVNAPGDEHHDHDGGELHDAERLTARFRHTLNILPPEIQGDDDGD